MQRAIGAIPVGAAEQDPALKSFLEGVTLTERDLLNALERHGIKRQQPLNEPFNPHLHQAVMEMPRSDVPEGTIVRGVPAGLHHRGPGAAACHGGRGQGRTEAAAYAGRLGGAPPPANENTPPG